MRLPVRFVICSLSTVLIFSSKNLLGQLCTGSLGEPVVNIDFGSGGSNGPPLDTTITNYNYIFGSCPDDGNYTITNQVPSCFGGTWHSVSVDHTANDADGYMMVVNASYEPGDFYVKKVDGLCDNTTYEFAAWILNVLLPSACNQSGIKPNVTFRIEKEDGTVLQTYETGDIPDNPSAVWKQYGVFFQTPPGVNTVIVRMTNNAPGGCGNDLILDDITFRPCGPLVDVSIQNANKSVTLCDGDTTVFNFLSNTTPSGTNTIYQWQQSLDSGKIWTNIAGATTSTYTRYAQPSKGLYQYRLAVAQGDYVSIPSCSRVMSEVLTVYQAPIPVVGAVNNGPVCEGASITLKANDGSKYLWRGPNNFVTTTPFPQISGASPADAGRYYLEFTSLDGCLNNDSTDVVVLPGPSVDAGADTSICKGESIQLRGTTNATQFRWSPADNLSSPDVLSPFANPATSITYILTADNGVCPISDSVNITVNMKPIADAGPDRMIVKGDTVTLHGNSNIPAQQILWSPPYALSNTDQLITIANPDTTTIYTLTVSNSICGSSSDEVLVNVFAGLFIPNAFSPNGDGINDVWRIAALAAYPQAKLRVYNRFGELIFQSTGGGNWWDGSFKGKIQAVGGYPFTIDTKDGRKTVKGVVYLVR